MAFATFTNPSAGPSEVAPLGANPGEALPQPAAAGERRGPLAAIQDFLLNLLDVFVRLNGLDGAEEQAPLPPVSWTVYPGNYHQAFTYGYGNRYRRWG
jgi:hypothetical protein